MTEQEALLVLNAVPLLGAIRIRRLMEFFGSALEVLQASHEELSQCQLFFPKIAENILYFSKDKFLKDEYNLMQRKKVVAITLADEDYPCSLKDFEDSPVVLYIKGEMGCLKQLSVAIVGSRAVSFHGCKSARAFAQAFVPLIAATPIFMVALYSFGPIASSFSQPGKACARILGSRKAAHTFSRGAGMSAEPSIFMSALERANGGGHPSQPFRDGVEARRVREPDVSVGAEVHPGHRRDARLIQQEADSLEHLVRAVEEAGVLHAQYGAAHSHG